MKRHQKSRQKEAITLYRKGFSQLEIAQILGVHQSTVSRYFNNPTEAEVEDFYENFAYGSNVLKSGVRVPFNRRYRNLEDIPFINSDVAYVEWYYNDGTYWYDRFDNSINQKPIYKT